MSRTTAVTRYSSPQVARLDKACERSISSASRALSFRCILQRAASGLGWGYLAWFCLLIGVFILNIATWAFGYTEPYLHNPNDRVDMWYGVDRYMVDGTGATEVDAEHDGMLISLPLLPTIQSFFWMPLATAMFWPFRLHIVPWLMQLCHSILILTRQVRTHEIPNSWQRYYNEAMGARREEMAALGGAFPNWTDGLSDYPDVLIANGDVMAGLADSRLTPENRAAGESQIKNALDELAQRLINYQKADNECADDEARREAILANERFGRLLK